MKHTAISFLLLVSATVAASDVKAAPADEQCDIRAGQGGLNIFPWHKGLKRVAYLGVHEVRTVFLPKGCGLKTRPTLHLGSTDNGLKTVIRKEGKRPIDVAFGWRIIFKTDDVRDLGKRISLEIDTESGHTFELEIWVVRSSRMAATKGVGLTKEMREALASYRGTDRRSRRALRRSRHALRIARKARARSQAGLELELIGNISLESPGREGGGTALGLNIIFGKYSGGVVQLGMSFLWSFQRYQLEIVGVPPNSDTHAQEMDLLGMFLLRIQPVRWLRFDANIGFGYRLFTHDDSVNVQETEEPYRVRGVEGAVDHEGLFAFGVGFSFRPWRNFYFGLKYLLEVSMTQQVLNPVVYPGDEIVYGNAKNHKLAIFAGVSW